MFMNWIQNLRIYIKPKLIAILLLGISSGLPLSLTASTFNLWLSDAGVDKTTIGLAAMVGVPYSLKFIWAPLFDLVSLPRFLQFLGRRRGWMLLSQAILMLAILALGWSNPVENLKLTVMLAILLSFTSATQDILIDAYRVELIEDREQGAGAAMIIGGYRIGMLISGAGALVLAEFFGWQLAYSVMVFGILIGVCTVLVMGEPCVLETPVEEEKGTASEVVVRMILSPFKDFMSKEGWFVILLFVITYKLGDAFAGVMIMPFFKEIGFTKVEIASISKVFGFGAILVGTFLGGIMVYRWNILKSLWVCGLLQMFSNLIFIVQHYVGHDTAMLMVTIGVENLATGMGGAAMVAYLSSLCVNPLYTATQYALLSSIAAIARTVLSAPSGYIVDQHGWVTFFIVSTLLAIPGLWFLLRGHRYIVLGKQKQLEIVPS